MKLFKRFVFYGIGLLIGSIFVYFIWEKKNVQFDYGPNARVLKNIRIKTQMYSSEVLNKLSSTNLDSATISQILKNGNVDIWDKIELDSCIQYNIKGRDSLKNITLTVLNCDSIATIERVLVVQ